MNLNKISPEHSHFIGHYKQKHVKRLHLKVGLKRTVYKTVTKQSLPSALLISVLTFPMWVIYFIPITRRWVISLFYFLSHSYTECIKWIKYLLYFIINIKKICLSISFPIIIWIQWLHTFKSDPVWTIFIVPLGLWLLNSPAGQRLWFLLAFLPYSTAFQDLWHMHLTAHQKVMAP